MISLSLISFEKISLKAKSKKLTFKNVEIDFSMMNFKVIEKNPFHRNDL
jgi:hypothetical protein